MEAFVTKEKLLWIPWAMSLAIMILLFEASPVNMLLAIAPPALALAAVIRYWNSRLWPKPNTRKVYARLFVFEIFLCIGGFVWLLHVM